MSEDKQKQRKAVMPIITLAVILAIQISKSLLDLIEKWLEDESGELVGHEDFPFHWFGGYEENPIFTPSITSSERSFLPNRYKILKWCSFEFRRGICIFVTEGAWVGISVAGNGTEVFMTYIPNTHPEYERVVIPMVRSYKGWLDQYCIIK